MTTVLVAFEVDNMFLSTDEAEDYVKERLESLPVLKDNDSNDLTPARYDSIRTYAIVPLSKLLMDSL